MEVRAQACGVVTIPATFVGHRAFATPVAVSDHRRLRFWIDSDGSGFIFDDVARHYAAMTGTVHNGSAQARLPRFARYATIPALTARGGTLSVLHRAEVAQDPIFAGLDGQLGASWLQRRVWTFDYPRSTLHWRCDGTEPYHPKDSEIPLSFSVNESGELVGGVQYPQMQIVIDGEPLLASLDTAATVALSRRAVETLRGSEPVEATSFVTHALVAQWHERHPSWAYVGNAGEQRGITAILVPLVLAGPVRFTDVWFTTRPDDDVFQGERETIKLGPTAFDCCVLTIDYVRRRAIVQKR
jgi:hypothetical protein